MREGENEIYGTVTRIASVILVTKDPDPGNIYGKIILKRP
jgi:hypothetical protein